MANIKYANGGINVESEHIKCDKHVVRITCNSIEEQERLLDVANVADTDVTASRPYAETNGKNVVEWKTTYFIYLNT